MLSVRFTAMKNAKITHKTNSNWPIVSAHFLLCNSNSNKSKLQNRIQKREQINDWMQEIEEWDETKTNTYFNLKNHYVCAKKKKEKEKYRMNELIENHIHSYPGAITCIDVWFVYSIEFKSSI